MSSVLIRLTRAKVLISGPNPNFQPCLSLGPVSCSPRISPVRDGRSLGDLPVGIRRCRTEDQRNDGGNHTGHRMSVGGECLMHESFDCLSSYSFFPSLCLLSRSRPIDLLHCVLTRAVDSLLNPVQTRRAIGSSDNFPTAR